MHIRWSKLLFTSRPQSSVVVLLRYLRIGYVHVTIRKNRRY
ncbi:hypothetical protein HMPREF9528_00094 [Staphylococcus aureus subsp. aureus MRSA131]|nr:hypothetical protein HMPREF9528_00094 [Staphylococcus aureus subsp. aureus MRSA131]